MRGILYVAFGTEYDKQAAYSAVAARRFSKLPICVLTNVRKHDQKWQQVSDVTFKHFAREDSDNRDIKTSMWKYSPFNKTMYTDTDTAIQSSKYEEAFDLLGFCDLAFPYHGTWNEGEKVTRLYRMAMDMFKVEKPLVVYQGGVCIFNKTEGTQKLFALWNQYWDKFGRGREMMCLACAAKNVVGTSIGMLDKDYGFPESKVIQHFYGANAPKTDLLPKICKNKAFDKKYGRGRWDLVD